MVNHVQLADGFSVTYTYSATVVSDEPDEFANTVSIAVDPGTVDPVPGNDSSSSVTAIALFHDGFDGR